MIPRELEQEMLEMGVEIPPEMFDFIKVMNFGAKKYAANNWLLPDGINSDHKSMHASIFRHVAESSCGHKHDWETGLHPLLHAATRCLMLYTRQQRGLE